MSLILREKCQPLLDDVGLDLLHVGITQKYFTIVGGCGKTLVTLGGIQFGSNNPTKRELDYAVDLFREFLRLNTKKLTDYVATSQSMAVIDAPPAPEGTEDSGGTLIIRKPDTQHVAMYIYSEGKIGLNGRMTINDVLALYPDSVADAAVEWYATKAAIAKRTQELNVMRAEINKCDI